MPFWGGSKNDGDTSGGETSFTSDDAAYGGSSMGGGDIGGAGGAEEIQQFALAIQQSIVVQKVISSLTDTSFEKCITSKPGESLSGSNVACIHSIVNKMIDTNEFMMGRLAKKQQQASGGGGGGGF
mmetsp:Transcript_7772/g.8897  ORF Transcript_7772/g.8897 Transcript_7772/m.8897 type:complete len:126 (-) Transcript_7772:152-529(-)|eukprot:CAMPEP_0194136246 /NCGR_PEP_ID=MMETSP0152-20130528/6274_1 /TAXON_ID=1049557 /ORGANISM="Thalassiothrix antarctica, Strain L6-D1" /LENGTH=125 /DNA_ID=CAMNT_0038832827 /DNA_START=39 /DNA_END=416 /DNA_ORIENTATION=+